MKTKQLITAATAAANSDKQRISSNNPMTFNGFGFSGSDVVDIQFSHDDGTTWVDCYREGSKIQLSATNNQVTVYGPGVFRASKGTTTGTVGVSSTTEQG